MMINPLVNTPLPNLGEASWLALGMSNQLGYIARDAMRVQAVPDHRKADTLARNFVPAFMIPLIMESAFRLVDTYYTMPLMSQALKLKQLGFNTMPEELRGRMVSRLVTPSSVFVVPRVLQKMDLPKATGETQRNLQKLTPHLQKMLCPTDHLDELVHQKLLQPSELQQIKTISSKLLEKLDIKELIEKGISSFDEPSMGAKLKALGQEHLNQHSIERQKVLLDYARMCVGSKFTQEMVKRIQKTATWQNMFMATLMSFVFYGLMANLLEVKVVRPWQKRIVAERGTAAEVVAPCYLATIPWLLTVCIGLSNKAPRFLQKMTHLNRFLAVSGVAFTSFAATAGIFIKRKLSGPPPANTPKTGPQAAAGGQHQSPANPQNSPVSGNGTSFGIGSPHKPYPYSQPQPFLPPNTSAAHMDSFQPTGNKLPTYNQAMPQNPYPPQQVNTFSAQQSAPIYTEQPHSPVFAQQANR